jgi:hypothetical protein
MSEGFDVYRIHDINSYTIQLVLCSTYVQSVFLWSVEIQRTIGIVAHGNVALMACWHRRGCRVLQNINMQGG